MELVGRRPVGHSTVDESYWRHYGIDTPFRVRRLGASRFLRDYDFDLRAFFAAVAQRADLVYARNLRAAAMASVWGLPLVFEAHSPPQTKFQAWLLRRVISGRGFRLMVVISDRLRQILLEVAANRLADPQVIVLPDGVDLERFCDTPNIAEARRRLGYPVEGFTAGYAGHLYAGRGIDLIVELARRHPRVHFEVAGGDARSVEDRRRRHTAIGNLRFVGFVANADLPLHLAACDVLLMPYQRQVSTTIRGDNNTVDWMSPMKMFEYMASGRAVLASDLPALREVLSEDNARLVPPDDVEAWAEALADLQANASVRTALAKRAEIDVQNYSWRKRVRAVRRSLEALAPHPQ